MPEFEHQQDPELGRSVAPAFVMRSKQLFDGRAAEVAALERAAVEEDVANVRPEGPAKPFSEGNRESPLRPLEHLVRDHASHRELERSLAGRAADLRRGGELR